MSVAVSFIKDILFPKYCFGCAKFGIYICISCKHRLQTLHFDICPYCRKKSYFGLTHPACKKENGVDGLKSIYRYNDVVKKITMQIKYRLVTDAFSEFFFNIPHEKMEELLFYRKLSIDCLLIPVPLHPHRLRQRGFNQSYEMARFFSKMLQFPLLNNMIIRKKNTHPQVIYSRPQERYLNVRGAFGFVEQVDKNLVENKQCIIVDDVWTTGWTIKEVAKVLKKQGAEKVFALTIAR